MAGGQVFAPPVLLGAVDFRLAGVPSLQRTKAMAKFIRPGTGPAGVVHRDSVRQGMRKISPGWAGSSPGQAGTQALHTLHTQRRRGIGPICGWWCRARRRSVRCGWHRNWGTSQCRGNGGGARCLACGLRPGQGDILRDCDHTLLLAALSQSPAIGRCALAAVGVQHADSGPFAGSRTLATPCGGGRSTSPAAAWALSAPAPRLRSMDRWKGGGP